MQKAKAQPAPPTPQKIERGRVVPGEVLVKLAPAARSDPNRLRQILGGLAPDCRIKSEADRFGIVLVQVAPSETARVIDGLNDNEAVEFAEPNFVESGA